MTSMHKLQSYHVQSSVKQFICLIVLFGMLLSSCSSLSNDNANKNSETEQIEQNSSETVGHIEIDHQQAENEKSDVLRLYLQNREDFNPLSAFDYTGKAAFTLLFRSLFTFDEGNILQADLVESARFIPERNMYEIKLKQGLTFSDNQIIKASDCISSILKYRDNLTTYLKNINSTVGQDVFMEETDQLQEEESNQSMDPNKIPKRINDESIKFNLLENDLTLLNQIEDIQMVDDYSFNLIVNSDKLIEVTTDTTENLSAESDNQESTDSNNISENAQNMNQKDMEEVAEDKTELGNLTSFQDPGILFALTMPILSSEEIDTVDIPTKSSGRYKVSKVAEDKISLVATDDSFTLQNINLVIFDNSTEAIRALEDDMLDAVYLAENDYNLYGKQNRKQMISFQGQRYYYISFGQGASVKDRQNIELLKQIWQVRDDIPELITGYQSISRLPLQYDDAAITLFNLLESQTNLTLKSEELNSLRKNSRKFKIITPDLITEKEWVLSLRESLLSLNIQIEIESIALDMYETALEEKDYDLAIRWIDIPYPMSFKDSFAQIDKNVFRGLSEEEEIILNQLNQYFYSFNRQFDPKTLDENIFQYRDFIKERFNKLNILGIGFEQVGIVFSYKVEGIPNSKITNPYAKLEELWVWQ